MARLTWQNVDAPDLGRAADILNAAANQIGAAGSTISGAARNAREDYRDRKSAEILADHPLNRQRELEGLPPANVVLIRGAGEMGRYEPFPERYHMTGSVIAAATLITGIGKAVGLEEIPVPDITGSADTNLAGKVETAIEIPDAPEELLPLLLSIPLQLLAYHVAVLKGTDVDQPRNLAKSVTVE